MSAYGSPTNTIFLAISSERLIPSDVFPPITESNNTPSIACFAYDTSVKSSCGAALVLGISSYELVIDPIIQIAFSDTPKQPHRYNLEGTHPNLLV